MTKLKTLKELKRKFKTQFVIIWRNHLFSCDFENRIIKEITSEEACGSSFFDWDNNICIASDEFKRLYNEARGKDGCGLTKFFNKRNDLRKFELGIIAEAKRSINRMTIKQKIEEVEKEIKGCEDCLSVSDASIPICDYHQGVLNTLKKRKKEMTVLENKRAYWEMKYKNAEEEITKLQEEKAREINSYIVSRKFWKEMYHELEKIQKAKVEKFVEIINRQKGDLEKEKLIKKLYEIFSQEADLQEKK